MQYTYPMNKICKICSVAMPYYESHTKCHNCRSILRICPSCGKEHKSVAKKCYHCSYIKNGKNLCTCGKSKHKKSPVCRKCVDKTLPLVDGNKFCYSCKNYLSLDNFHKYHKGPHGFEYNCKACNKKYLIKIKDKDSYKESIKRSYTKVKQKIKNIRKEIYKYLELNGCVDCGNKDPLVLEFDHVRGSKSANVAKLLGGYSLEKILEEIAKCEIRCANCHTRKTAKDRNYLKYRIKEGTE